MNEQSKVRILVADDHAVMREGLCLLINSQADMEVIGQAGDGQEALQMAGDCHPDVAVMDISMPKLDGARATERLKQMCPEVKVLVLTRHDDSGYLRRLLQAGATGYVLKRTPGAELIGAIRTVATGGTYLDPEVADKLVETFVGKPGIKNSVNGKPLTIRETEVIKWVARGKSNKEIAHSLSISVKTVEAHKAHAMEKLELHNRAGVIQYALLHGWLEE